MSKASSVLKLFLDYPDRWFSVRDVSRELGIGWVNAQDKILDYIDDTGILEMRSVSGINGGRRKEYRISKKRISAFK